MCMRLVGGGGGNIETSRGGALDEGRPPAGGVPQFLGASVARNGVVKSMRHRGLGEARCGLLGNAGASKASL